MPHAVLGLVAVVMAVVALRRVRRGPTGKGFAITGLVLGALGLLVSAAMWVFLVATVQSLEDGDLDAIVREIREAAEAETGMPTGAGAATQSPGPGAAHRHPARGSSSPT